MSWQLTSSAELPESKRRTALWFPTREQLTSVALALPEESVTARSLLFEIRQCSSVALLPVCTPTARWQPVMVQPVRKVDPSAYSDCTVESKFMNVQFVA